MKYRHALTLIELLVVIAIIGVLASLLVVGMGRARASVENATCVSNLRQVGIGLLLFAADNHDMIPAREYAVEFKADGSSTFSHWHRRLGREGYVEKSNQYGDSDVFYCPSFAPRGPSDPDVADPIHPQRRYGMRSWVPMDGNWALNDKERLLPLNAIEDPSDFFLVVDSIQTSWGLQGYFVAQGSNEWRIHLRHGGKANAVFADGHVASNDVDYFERLHERQRYGGSTNGRPFRTWPENE